jgi:hypothetical protein
LLFQKFVCRMIKESTFRNLLILKMVGTGRFELPTPRTPSECSTRLSHVPTERQPDRERGRLRGHWLVYTGLCREFPELPLEGLPIANRRACRLCIHREPLIAGSTHELSLRRCILAAVHDFVGNRQ